MKSLSFCFLVGMVCLAGVAAAQDAKQGSTETFVIEPAEARVVTWDEISGQYAERPAPARIQSGTQAGWQVRDATQARQMREERMKEVATRLNLSEDQQKQLGDLMEQHRTRFEQWRNDPQKRAEWESLSGEERHARMREYGERSMQEAAAVLDEKQLEEWRAMRAEMFGRHHGGRRGGDQHQPGGPQPTE